MLTREGLKELVQQVYESCPGNVIGEEQALDPALVGLKMFEAPLVGFGAAGDELFDRFTQREVIGPWFMGPEQWLPGAQTVVSLFFPFTEEVKQSNRSRTDGPSLAWLHGRIEGQAFLAAFSRMLRDALLERGVPACAPAVDERSRSAMGGSNFKEYEGVDEQTFGSNWSERHAGFVCGLGTFGLSKGLITQKGIAGRLASVIIGEKLEPDLRPYTDLYEYCSKCGACVRRCPMQAISVEEGKKHPPCHAMLKKTKEQYGGHLGCGLCQTKVPCESGIPGRK